MEILNKIFKFDFRGLIAGNELDFDKLIFVVVSEINDKYAVGDVLLETNLAWFESLRKDFKEREFRTI